jgi:hypothetical protein
MKTIIKSLLILAFVTLASIVTVGQITWFQSGYMTSTSKKITEQCPVGTMIYVGTSFAPYKVIKAIGANTMTLAQAVSGSYAIAQSAVNLNAYYVDTATNRTKHGTMGFFNALYAYSTSTFTGTATFNGSLVSATPTLAGHALAKTSGNGNSATYSGSWVLGSGDSLTAAKIFGTTYVSIAGQTLQKSSGDANSLTLSHSLVVGATGDSLTSTHGFLTDLAVFGHLIAKTSGNDHSLTVNSSWVLASGDTLTAPVASFTTKVYSPVIYCTGANGAIFTGTDGTTHYKLQIASGGVATFVTVTP